MRILVVCTGNSARSQMAEGFLRSLDQRLEVHSAGTEPAARVDPQAVAVMGELGIDLTASRPKSVERFLGDRFDAVITVCGEAERACPRFTGPVTRRIHLGFEDPARAEGSEEEVRAAFRRVRDQILEKFREFYESEMKGAL